MADDGYVRLPITDGRLLLYRVFTQEYSDAILEWTGVRVTSVKLREGADSFGLVFSGLRGSESVVAFLENEDLNKLLEVAAKLLPNDALSWKKDKFAK